MPFIRPGRDLHSSWNHYFLQNISTAMWTDIETQMAIWGDPNPTAQARVNAIPTTGGVLLTNATGTQIATALSANSVVRLAGSCATSADITIPAGKTLTGIPGAETQLDCSACGFNAIQMNAGSNLAHLNIIGPNPGSANAGIGVNIFQDNCTVFKISIRDGYGTNNPGIACIDDDDGTPRTFNNVIVSCEVVRFGDWFAGEDCDGFRSTYAAHSNTFIDCHAVECTDDGFDFWRGDVVWLYYCYGRRNGKHPTRTNANGAGYKLGRAVNYPGAKQHRLYKCGAIDNKRWALDYSENTGPHYVIGGFDSSLNGSGTYSFGPADEPGGATPKYKLTYP